MTAKAVHLMQEEIRQLLRELVRQGGGDPEPIAPTDPPWTRAADTPRAPPDPEPTVEEDIR